MDNKHMYRQQIFAGNLKQFPYPCMYCHQHQCLLGKTQMTSTQLVLHLANSTCHQLWSKQEDTHHQRY